MLAPGARAVARDSSSCTLAPRVICFLWISAGSFHVYSTLTKYHWVVVHRQRAEVKLIVLAQAFTRLLYVTIHDLTGLRENWRRKPAADADWALRQDTT